MAIGRGSLRASQCSRITSLTLPQRSLTSHFLTSNVFNQGFQISHLWNRVRLLPKVAQGEGIVPGSQRDPYVGFRGGRYQAGSAAWCCVPWLSAWPWERLGQQRTVPAHLHHVRCQRGLEATRLWISLMALPLFNWVALAFYSCSLTLNFLICEKTVRIKGNNIHKAPEQQFTYCRCSVTALSHGWVKLRGGGI